MTDVEADPVFVHKRPTKPDVGLGRHHPAPFSKKLMPYLQDAVPPDLYPVVFDPYGGTGLIHVACSQFTIAGELEPEWVEIRPDNSIMANALCIPIGPGLLPAIVTSPTFGNRYADHHNARDASMRRSYKHDLGRDPHPTNTGIMHWGDEYRDAHLQHLLEFYRVLRAPTALDPPGRFVLNMKNHIRGKQEQHVNEWWISATIKAGFTLVKSVPINAQGYKVGKNREARTPIEWVHTFDVDKEAA